MSLVTQCPSVSCFLLTWGSSSSLKLILNYVIRVVSYPRYFRTSINVRLALSEKIGERPDASSSHQAFFCFFRYRYPLAAIITMMMIAAGSNRDEVVDLISTGISMLFEMTVSPLMSLYLISLLIP